jgi:hypothetical protein
MTKVSEGVPHCLKEAAKPVVSVEGFGSRQFLDRSHVDVAVQVLEDRLFARVSKGFMAAAHDLDVLLRHRLLRAGGFEGFGRVERL